MTLQAGIGRTCEAIGNLSISVPDERVLQEAIDQRLRQSGLSYEREWRLSPQDRIDFVVHAEGNIGIEVKIDGTCPQLMRQVHRYLAHGTIDGMVIVTTRARLTRIPAKVRSKPVVVHLLTASLI